MKKSLLVSFILFTIVLVNSCNTMGYYSEGKDVYYGKITITDIVYNSEGILIQETIEKDNLQIIISYDDQQRVIQERVSNGETYNYIFNEDSFVIDYYLNGVLISTDIYYNN